MHPRKTSVLSIRALRKAARDGEVEKVRSMLADKADPNAKTNKGETALHAAAATDAAGTDAHNATIVRMLVDAKANVASKPVFGGYQPLHQAVRKKGNFRPRCKVISALVSCKADIEAHDNKGFTPLAHAAENGALAHVRHLLKLKANPDGTTKDLSPLYAACWRGAVDVVKVLLDAGADPLAGEEDPANYDSEDEEDEYELPRDAANDIEDESIREKILEMLDKAIEKHRRMKAK